MSKTYEAWFECRCGQKGTKRVSLFYENPYTIQLVDTQAIKDGANHYNSIPTPDSPEKRQQHQYSVKSRTVG